MVFGACSGRYFAPVLLTHRPTFDPLRHLQFLQSSYGNLGAELDLVVPSVESPRMRMRDVESITVGMWLLALMAPGPEQPLWRISGSHGHFVFNITFISIVQLERPTNATRRWPLTSGEF